MVRFLVLGPAVWITAGWIASSRTERDAEVLSEGRRIRMDDWTSERSFLANRTTKHIFPFVDFAPAEDARDEVHRKLVMPRRHRCVRGEDALFAHGVDVLVGDRLPVGLKHGFVEKLENIGTLRSAAARIVSPASTPRPPL